MKVLAISYLYPNCIYPNHGIFVHNRLKAILKFCDVKVINPIPWFPFSHKFKRYRGYNQIPLKENMEGIEVFHPRFFIIPRYVKFLDTFTFCLSVVPIAIKFRREFDFDLIDLHWTYPDILSGRVLAILFNKKLLLTVRGKEALNFFPQKHPPIPNSRTTDYRKEISLRSKMLDYFLPKSNAVIALSKELKKLCMECNVSPEKIEVIRNGIAPGSFYFLEKKVCRSKLNLPEDKLVILSVGSLIFAKGFDRLIAIFPDILKEYPNAMLFIIGSDGPAGDYRKELASITHKHGIEDKICFLGQIPNNDLIYWYNAADLFCLPSRSEGSPNVLSEALACGCPSVTTDVGSASEILNCDCLGRVIPNNESQMLSGILSALGSTFERQAISDRIRKYDWNACAIKVVQLYKRLLKEDL